jgi:hypothetical protein
LAILRIVILGELFIFNLDPLPSLAHLTYAGMNHVWGYGWLAPFLPPSAHAVVVAMFVFKVLAFLSLIGFFTRYTLPAFAFVSFWMMLGPHFVGKMQHYHFQWLGLAILAMSPCADALSVDAWLARKKRVVEIHRASIKYGRAFFFLWCMMGAVYFFPGYWKFVVSGWHWAFSDNVRFKILAKAFETGQTPLVPLYNYPWLCRLGGLGTLVFEMGFPLAMIFPRTRILFAVGGLGFHELNRFVMQIPFVQLEWFYMSFGNWSSLLKLGRLPEAVRTPFSYPRWKIVWGSVLVGGLVLTGFLGLESWPWSVFPTFAPIEQSFVNSISMEIERPGSSPQYVLLQTSSDLIAVYMDRTRLRAYLNSVLVEPDPAQQASMLGSLFSLLKKSLPAEAKVRFWQVQVPLWPLNSQPKLYKLLPFESDTP